MEAQQTMFFKTTSSVDQENSSRLVFEKLINKTVDSVFLSLGPVCRQTVYGYLENNYGLKKNDVADHILEFSEALEEIFGCAAALLEIQIIKRLSREVPQFKYRPEGALTFPDYVHALSEFLSSC